MGPTMAVASRHRSSATPLSLAYAMLVLYASLYPFSDWRWPPGQGLARLAALAWSPYADAFDVWSNLLGYLPLGALLVVAARRSGLSRWLSLLLAIGLSAGLSYGTEVAQQFLPGRHPSLKDFALNASGAALGAVLAWMAHGLGWISRWQRVRERWFLRDSAGALALLALWPVGLLFPTPAPLGLGQVGGRLRELLASMIEDVPWASTAQALLATAPTPIEPLRPFADALITTLGLLAPCVVAFSVVRPGWRRAALAAGVFVAALANMALSAALNFGPQHAMAWMTPLTLPALGVGLLLACLLAPLPRRLMAGVGLIVITALAAFVAQAPDDPYFAQSLQAWEQGRFVRFHGVAQWVGWLWPYLAMAWLVSRLAGAPDGRR
jgi:VanZ family protein